MKQKTPYRSADPEKQQMEAPPSKTRKALLIFGYTVGAMIGMVACPGAVYHASRWVFDDASTAGVFAVVAFAVFAVGWFFLVKTHWSDQ